MTTPAEAMIETLKNSQMELVAMRKDLDAMRKHMRRLVEGVEFCLREVEKAMNAQSKAKP
ncbi:hypothetical protein FSB08_20165 [Paraburkholderia sp. JPY432]|uniref:hypothetical protein n=1 Tax=Paraburkholderia youngii TaxID=2782701 RepID=UPI00159530D0|nr:hypothetical protein [Paraburkholderia youngii]NVH74785.1 hypothetical protein [Paraburkholderia youngii]